MGAGGASPKPPKQVAWGWDKNKSPCWVCGLAFIAPSCYLWGHLISHSNFPLKTPSRWLCRLPASWIKASDSSVFHQIARFPSEWSPWLTPIKTELAGLPRGPVAKTLRSQCRGLGSIPGQETRSHKLQQKLPQAATKTQHSQVNK